MFFSVPRNFDGTDLLRLRTVERVLLVVYRSMSLQLHIVSNVASDRQHTVDAGQQTADAGQQTADARQQTADAGQHTADTQ